MWGGWVTHGFADAQSFLLGRKTYEGGQQRALRLPLHAANPRVY